jgi:hypothetical protein
MLIDLTARTLNPSSIPAHAPSCEGIRPVNEFDCELNVRTSGSCPSCVLRGGEEMLEQNRKEMKIK